MRFRKFITDSRPQCEADLLGVSVGGITSSPGEGSSRPEQSHAEPVLTKSPERSPPGGSQPSATGQRLSGQLQRARVLAAELQKAVSGLQNHQNCHGIIEPLQALLTRLQHIE